MKYVNGNVFFRNEILNTYPYVNRDLESDICIIGGGVSGLITAYFLASQSKKIILVEKNIIGYGNSSCDFGILDFNINKIEKLKSEEEVKKIINLYNSAKKDFLEIAEKIDYKNIKKAKKVIFTNKIMQKANMQKYINIQKKYNISCYLKENEEKINSNLSIEFNEEVMVINTYEFIQKLAMYITKNLNVDIYENTKIVDIQDTYDDVQLITNNDFYINTKKLIYCTGVDFFNIVDLPDIDVYQKCSVITKYDEKLKDEEKVYYNFNSNDFIFKTGQDPRVMLSDNSLKINIKLLDDDYRRYVEKDKFTKLAICLNKLIKQAEYVEMEYCYSYISCETKDGLPYIDELECKDNCFCNVPLGQNTVLSSIIGGKMLKNIVKGLFTKEMKFFKLTRGNCN